MICACTSKGKTEGGWTHRPDDEMWVCGQCRLPTPGFLESYMARKNDEQGEAGTHLNLLRYGPLHNVMLTNTELLDRRDLMRHDDWDNIEKHLTDYRWSSEVLVGQSGKRARVWVWKEQPVDA